MRILNESSLESLDGSASVTEPTRFSFLHPLKGGAPLSTVRKALVSLGRARFFVDGERLSVDVDPGREKGLIALDMIVRSDAQGLQRVVESALSEVDEIVIGVDGRSDDETRKVAEAFADIVWTFDADDLKLSRDDWTQNRIHFANARNLGRQKVQAPWTLFLDSDEVLKEGRPLKEWVRDHDQDGVGAFGIRVELGDVNHLDTQRLARTRFRWVNQTHNMLVFDESAIATDRVIMHDTSLRSQKEIDRRNAQRSEGVDGLKEEAEKGHVGALFHLAKHRAYEGALEEAVHYTTEYRARTEPHGLLSSDRGHLAALLAIRFFEIGDDVQAELWGFRSLLDGPNVESFCVLGDVAELREDIQSALIWYEAACLTPTTEARIQIPGAAAVRWGRRDALRRVLSGDKAVPKVESA